MSRTDPHCFPPYEGWEEDSRRKYAEQLAETDPVQWAMEYASPMEHSKFFGLDDDRPICVIYEEERRWHEGHRVLLRRPSRHLL